MSSSLEAAFNFLCSMKSIKGLTLTRNGNTIISVPVNITPCNYSRNIDGPESTVSYSNEYLIPKTYLESSSIREPRRGDILEGAAFRAEAIVEVDPLYNLGGTIFGWRVRTA